MFTVSLHCFRVSGVRLKILTSLIPIRRKNKVLLNFIFDYFSSSFLKCLCDVIKLKTLATLEGGWDFFPTGAIKIKYLQRS